MSETRPVRALFVDVGGVLLTNGWDHEARALAARTFRLDPADLEERHHQTFDTYEEGKISLEEYLNRTVFCRKRPFTLERFRRFMLARSRPYPGMLELVRGLKARHGLRIAVVSNEGRELMVHRIRKFGLDGFVDFFIASSFVHIRKPDLDIFRLALDVAQVPAGNVAYVENLPMFVEVARTLGIRGIHHTGEDSTRARLAELGLK